MQHPKAFRWVRRLLILAMLAGGAAYASRWWKQTQTTTDLPKFETATISRGDLVQAVTASGQLNPVVKVEVGSQISGIIQKLHADFNSALKEGQLIAELDAGTYEANAIQAEGNLANAKAALELAQINEARAKTLRADKLNAQAEYDQTLADLHKAEANVKINEGALKKAQVDLGRCKIYSPIDGIVISRNVDVGQTVAASLSAPILFLIANDLSEMQILAMVDESDIGMIKTGQPVQFTVQSYPGQSFTGSVEQVRLQSTTQDNVVNYTTVISVKNPTGKLLPGMTATVQFLTGEATNVLTVPNAALRIKPTPEMLAKSGLSATAARNSGNSASDTARRVRRDSTTARSSNSRGAAGSSAAGTVWVVDGKGALKPVRVRVGLSDGSKSEVQSPALVEGAQVITGTEAPVATAAAAAPATSPFQTQGGGRRPGGF